MCYIYIIPVITAQRYYVHTSTEDRNLFPGTMSGMTLSGGTASVIGTGAVELTETGGRALKLQTDTPHLVSMGGGRLSTAVTLHPIPQGEQFQSFMNGPSPPINGPAWIKQILKQRHDIKYFLFLSVYFYAYNLPLSRGHFIKHRRWSQSSMLSLFNVCF